MGGGEGGETSKGVTAQSLRFLPLLSYYVVPLKFSRHYTIFFPFPLVWEMKGGKTCEGQEATCVQSASKQEFSGGREEGVGRRK